MRYSEALTLIIQGNKATGKATRPPCPSNHKESELSSWLILILQMQPPTR
jgi:hypothetical protein